MKNKFWAEEISYQGPQAPLGLITGSDLWGFKRFPEGAKEPDVKLVWEGQIPTPYPPKTDENERLSPRIKHLRVGQRDVICFLSHGWVPNEDPYETMASQKIFWIFWRAGVKWVIGGGTCGLLNNAIWPGDLIIPSDFIDYTVRRVSALPGTKLDFPQFQILQRFKQAICPNIANAIHNEAKKLNFPRVHGYNQGLVHAITQGPRFETPAEVEKFRHDGCDTIGQSMSPEVTLARACGIHIAFVYYGVNPAEGLLAPKWNLDEIHKQLRLKMAKLHLRVLKTLPLDETCDCLRYREERPVEYLINP